MSNNTEWFNNSKSVNYATAFRRSVTFDSFKHILQSVFGNDYVKFNDIGCAFVGYRSHEYLVAKWDTNAISFVLGVDNGMPIIETFSQHQDTHHQGEHAWCLRKAIKVRNLLSNDKFVTNKVTIKSHKQELLDKVYANKTEEFMLHFDALFDVFPNIEIDEDNCSGYCDFRIPNVDDIFYITLFSKGRIDVVGVECCVTLPQFKDILNRLKRGESALSIRDTLSQDK